MDSSLILPGDPLFDWTLATAKPPGWQQSAAQTGEQVAFVASVGSGILRPASRQEMNDYLYGGEYDDRLEEIEETEEWTIDSFPI